MDKRLFCVRGMAICVRWTAHFVLCYRNPPHSVHKNRRKKEKRFTLFRHLQGSRPPSFRPLLGQRTRKIAPKLQKIWRECESSSAQNPYLRNNKRTRKNETKKKGKRETKKGKDRQQHDCAIQRKNVSAAASPRKTQECAKNIPKKTDSRVDSALHFRNTNAMDRTRKNTKIRRPKKGSAPRNLRAVLRSTQKTPTCKNAKEYRKGILTPTLHPHHSLSTNSDALKLASFFSRV